MSSPINGSLGLTLLRGTAFALASCICAHSAQPPSNESAVQRASRLRFEAQMTDVGRKCWTGVAKAEEAAFLFRKEERRARAAGDKKTVSAMRKEISSAESFARDCAQEGVDAGVAVVHFTSPSGEGVGRDSGAARVSTPLGTSAGNPPRASVANVSGTCYALEFTGVSELTWSNIDTLIKAGAVDSARKDLEEMLSCKISEENKAIAKKKLAALGGKKDTLKAETAAIVNCSPSRYVGKTALTDAANRPRAHVRLEVITTCGASPKGGWHEFVEKINVRVRNDTPNVVLNAAAFIPALRYHSANPQGVLIWLPDQFRRQRLTKDQAVLYPGKTRKLVVTYKAADIQSIGKTPPLPEIWERIVKGQSADVIINPNQTNPKAQPIPVQLTKVPVKKTP